MTRKKWLVIAAVGLLIVGGLAIWLFVATPFSEKQQQIREQDAKATQLFKDHENCVEKLSQDYTKLDSKNQAAYKKAFDICEAIRKEQNQAVDDYKQLTQS